MLRCSDNLPTALYTAEQVRALDAWVINQHGVPGIQLMLKASRALLSTLEIQWPQARELTLFCGKGNNAGDAYLLAALAVERGYQANLWQVGPAAEQGDALTARERALDAGVRVTPWQGQPPTGDLIVDGLLGTGLRGEVRSPYAEAINAINDSGLPVLAVDIPSGLCADTGQILGTAVHASVTVSFIGLKRGQFTGAAADCCGHLYFSDLEAPAATYETQAPSAQRLRFTDYLNLLPARKRTAHKGHFGHVLIVGGDHGMAGAALLAASAAARSGAGLVSCATRSEHISAFISSRPEIMAHPVESASQLSPLLERASVMVVGPGLGQGKWGRALLQHCLSTDKPLLLDADALNLLGPSPNLQRTAPTVITPHPGEAARLLDSNTAQIQADRFASAQSLRQFTGATVLLKGAGTVIATEDGLSVCNTGNPGMATGGMGDVLSGVIGGLLAQHLSADDATRLGACAHGAAADLAASRGERGLLASDVIDHLTEVLNS